MADVIRAVVQKHDDIQIIKPDRHSAVNDSESVIVMEGVDLVLTAKPELRVLAVKGDGRTACLYALLPQATHVTPLTPSTLVDFIRTSAPSQRLGSP
jgi:hypothetical protein